MEPQKKSNGALIGSIIVIVILIAGGVYFWMTKVDQKPLLDENQQEALDQTAAAVIEADNALGSIESDIDVSETETLNLESAINEVE